MDHAAQFRPLKRLFSARLYCNRKTVTVGLQLATALDAFNQAVILDVVMPAKSARGDDRSTKRVKLDATSSNTYHYSDGADIERRLQAQTQDTLLAGEFLFAYHMSGLLTYPFVALTALRNQLTLKAGEGSIQPQDERLTLARSWLEAFPGAQSIFTIWESTTEVCRHLSCGCFILC